MKPKCNEQCTRNIQGARVRACSKLNNVELQDVHGNYYHKYCQIPKHYEEVSNE